jgi:hypothetical protein
MNTAPETVRDPDLRSSGQALGLMTGMSTANRGGPNMAEI